MHFATVFVGFRNCCFRILDILPPLGLSFWRSWSDQFMPPNQVNMSLCTLCSKGAAFSGLTSVPDIGLWEDQQENIGESVHLLAGKNQGFLSFLEMFPLTNDSTSSCWLRYTVLPEPVQHRKPHHGHKERVFRDGDRPVDPRLQNRPQIWCCSTWP